MALHAYPGKVIVHNMERGEATTSSGFILGNDEGKAHGLRARWAQVYARGDDITDVNVGDWILVQHGRWTRGIDIDGIHMYMVDWPAGVSIVSKTKDMPTYISKSQHKKAGEFEFRPEDFQDFTGKNAIEM